MIKARVRRAAKRALQETFRVGEHMGVHVTLVRYDQPVPDTRTLGHAIWDRRTEMPGVDLNTSGQLELLERLTARFRSEYDDLPLQSTGSPLEYFIHNGSFESVDGEMLYAMVRDLRPRRMIEVGSGASTLLAAQGLLRNEADGSPPCDYSVCDPFPRVTVRNGVPGVSRLIAEPVQRVPLEFFESLEADDILFIDSSHVLQIGSDVQFEFLEVIPRLKNGVVVHVHDIFTPAEYPQEWVMKEHRFWTEQYLLQAFLAFNADFEVLWAGSYMHLTNPSRLAASFSSYRPGSRPGSFWFRRRNATAFETAS
jgi:hypothetical protein